VRVALEPAVRDGKLDGPDDAGYYAGTAAQLHVGTPVLTVDKASGLPLYLQIKHQIVYELATDRLRPGMALPSIRQLAASLRVTTVTVRHAYAVLEAEGLVVSHPGKSVLVAELSADARAQVSLRQSGLVDLFAAALERARALGYSTEEIQVAISRAMSAAGRPRVAFVGDLRVEVVGVSLRDLRERGPEALHPLDPPQCVAALVRSYVEVRDLLEGTGPPVVGLALELTAETQAELLALPNQARALLVAERVNLVGMAHLIEPYWVPDTPLAHVALESRDLASALRGAEAVIHSLHARRAAARHTPRDCPRIELHFALNPMSLARLREVIGAEQAGAAEAQMARPA
jgi:DNA-binding transcriptional regulator YhcF (GntR family)